MIKKLFILLAVPVLLASQGCKTKGTDETTQIPGMTEVDLNQYGLALAIQAPDETKGKLEVTNPLSGGTEIRVGKDFQISIKLEDGDIALKKSDIAGDDVNKFKRYVIDEATTILWESQITDPEFHFYTIVKVGKDTYVIEDIKDEHFSESSAKAMLESAKGLKEKVAAPANP